MKMIRIPRLHSIARFSFVLCIPYLATQIANADQFPDWVFEKKLTAADEQDGDEYGRDVAISGDFAVIGARSEDGAGTQRGAAYVVNYKTGAELFKLTASNESNNSEFGRSVAISGNRAVIGADEKNGMTGSAYLFDITTGVEERILVPSVVEAGALFGLSCDIDGNYVIVGAPYESVGGTGRGAVYVFDATTGMELFRLTTPGGGSNGDQFGHSVAVSGNYAIVGAPFANGGGNQDAGEVYVFDLSDGAAFEYEAVPSMRTAFGEFGFSVAAHGSLFAVGAPDEGGGGLYWGAAYLFNLSDGMLLKRIVPDNVIDNTEFGNDVDISDDLMIVGAFEEPSGGNDRGAAYVFGLPDGNLLQRIAAPDGQNFDYFGIGVAVNNEYAFAGADEEKNGAGARRGAVYVFEGTNLPTSACNPALKTSLLNKAKKLQKKAKAAQKRGQVATAKKLKKKAKMLIKKAKALC